MSVQTRAVWNSNGSAFWHLPEEQREQLCQLVEAHGFMRDDVFRIEYDVRDAPVLVIDAYRKDEDGHWHITGMRRTKLAADRRVVLLKQPLPDWWRPLVPAGVGA